jgi:hypothetical protein
MQKFPALFWTTVNGVYVLIIFTFCYQEFLENLRTDYRVEPGAGRLRAAISSRIVAGEMGGGFLLLAAGG